MRFSSWVEFWQRKKRQYYCHQQTWTERTFGLTTWTPHWVRPQCGRQDDDLRLAVCTNKNAKHLLDVLKSELECGWDSAALSAASGRLVAVAVVFVATVAVWRH